MSAVRWDGLASPDQVGEIHRLGMDRFDAEDIESVDEEVRVRLGKYPQELTRDEAAQLIRLWGGK